MGCVSWVGDGAHPRSRGDHGNICVESGHGLGSSPLARGPLVSGSSVRRVRGLIPARAGTTIGGVRACRSRWAHPRSRGDHLSHEYKENAHQGSSPLARGPLRAVCSCRCLKGLIPARAGTTVAGFWWGCLHGAHPRSRGDHHTPRYPRSLHEGSSPLARGPHKSGSCSRRLLGLIPARAGTTPYPVQRSAMQRAHPRSRGDHLEGGYNEPPSLWLIPARAGTTRLPAEG